MRWAGRVCSGRVKGTLIGLVLCFAGIPGSGTVVGAQTSDVVTAASPSFPQVSLPLTQEERDWLAAHPVITFSVDDAYPPRNFRDSTGNLAGISIDYVRLLAERLGIKVQFRGSDWNEALQKAMRHDVDGVVNADLIDERKPYLNFTDVYLEYPQALVVRREEPPVEKLESFSGRRVASKSGSSQLVVLQEVVPGVRIVPVPDLDTGLDLLSEGHVDGLFDDMACLYDSMSKRFMNNLRFGLVFREPPAGYTRLGLRNDEPLLLSVFNKAIASITSEDHKRLQRAWLPTDLITASQPRIGVTLSEEEKAWLGKHPTITVTTDMNFPPYAFRNETGQAEGIIAEVAEHVERLLGIKIEFTGKDYASLTQSVMSGTPDVTTLNDPLDAPYQAHYLKTQDYLFLPYSLWVRKDSPLLSARPRGLKGQRIALTKGWALNHPFLRSFGGNTFIQEDVPLDCINAVLSGRADACLEVYGVVDYIQQNSLVQNVTVLEVYYDGCPAAFYVRKDWPELHTALDKALKAIPPGEYQTILSHWISHFVDPSMRLKVLDFTPEERAWLRENPTVRVASDSYWAPIESMGKSGQIEGVASDYLRRVEQMLGIRFEVVPSRSWSEAVEGLRIGRMDMAPGIVPTPEREKFLDFTPPYLSLPAGIFSRDDVTYIDGLDRLAGKRVGVVEGESTQEFILREYPKIKLVSAPTVPEALHALIRGETDAFVGNVGVTTHYIRSAGLAQLKVVGETPYRYDICMAVRKDLPLLSSILSKSLNALSVTERDAIFQKWFTVKYEHGFDYAPLWKILVTVVLIVGIFIAWNRWLSRTVKKRTADLSASNARLRAEIEERTQAEAALQASEERFRLLFDLVPYSCTLTDFEGRYHFVNKAFLKEMGRELDEVIGRGPSELGLWMEPEAVERVLEGLSDGGGCDQLEIAVRHGEAPLRNLLLSSRYTELSGERRILSAVIDITERKKTEDRMREVTECLLSLEPHYQRNVQHITSLCGRLFGGSAAYYCVCAHDGLKSIGEWRSELDEPAGACVASVCADLMRRALDGPLAVSDLSKELNDGLGAEALGLGSKSYFGHPVRSAGETVGVLSVVFASPTDISEDDKRILGILAAALGVEEQRNRAEEQLRQAQKMEAVGQLAGGVAHDFNNLLQVINGYTEVALEELGEKSPVSNLLQEVAKAGERSARLVRQLLTFSRRQVIRPEPLDVNDVVTSLLKMLGRVLGEHIAIRFTPDANVQTVFADRGQVEQVLMNLSVNARDAMPSGGTLTIETRNVEVDEEFCLAHAGAVRGRYVRLSVSDTGCGIDPEVMKRIFDPFFTTKGVGKGTGLGLATVYGIVRQHDGFLEVSSEVEKGSTFAIYFPEVDTGVQETALREHQELESGSETILLAEDEDMVRDITSRLLEKAGYHVISARDGEEALALVEEHGPHIALAILDVVMPGLGGCAVYERLKVQFPHIRFLFTSGYNMDGVHTDFIVNEGFELLQKPFERALLLKKVRQQLGTDEAVS